MKVSDIGEFGLIERISKKAKYHSNVLVGIGDDAAVLRPDAGKLIVATTDTMVEGVHFDLSRAPYFCVGWKALSSNISDILAMGGSAGQALVTVGLPKNSSVKDVDELYRGIRALADRYGIDIIGGDTVSSPLGLIVSITLLGEVEKKHLLLRSGAKVGDVIMVTGTLGDSGAGLGSAKLKVQSSKLIKKHLMPEPRVKESVAIASSRLATSMIDDSDGLARCVLEICRMSRVGAAIDIGSIPISKEIRKYCEDNDLDPIDLALNGGEDYELIFTASKENASRIKNMVVKRTRTKVSIIGEITDKKFGMKLIGENGRVKPLLATGYDHFRGNR